MITITVSKQHGVHGHVEGCASELLGDTLSVINAVFTALDEDIREDFRGALVEAVTPCDSLVWEINDTAEVRETKDEGGSGNDRDRA